MSLTPGQLVALYREHGSLKAVMRATGEPWRQVRNAYLEAVDSGLMRRLRPGAKTREELKNPDESIVVAEGRVHAVPTGTRDLPAKGKVSTYLLTCAQNDTLIHEGLWQNILALQDHYDAEVMVSRCTYVRSGLGTRGDKANVTGRGNTSTGSTADLTWDPRLADYVQDDRVELAPGLVWCGEMNILPTAVNPLSGLEVYTGRKSGIFPHVKLAMESIPSGKSEPTKFNYTTGTVTQRNYIQRKAGLKAEFHHCFHPETEFLTDKGIRTLRNSEGERVNVWSGASWERAKVRSFGKQKLNRVTLVPAVLQNCNGTEVHRVQRSKISHVVRVTPEHTWHLADGSISRDLVEGDVIPAAIVTPQNEGPDFEEGVRHGLIFGDGSVIYRSEKDGQFSHQLCVHGDAVGRWVDLFGGVGSLKRWPSREYVANYVGTVYYKSATNMKELPNTRSNPAYLRGFFVGWLAADGHTNKRDGGFQLCSVTKHALDWAVKHSPYAGFIATGYCKGSGGFTTFGKIRKPVWRLTLTDLPRYWKVSTIEVGLEPEDVMCAVVEPSHKFTLAGGILTGNCYGALLVEVDSDGDWFVRQLNADSDGTLYDLDLRVHEGRVESGVRAEAVTWGDIHAPDVPESTVMTCWGSLGIMDVLDPRYQFFHDLLDFRARNHHDRDNPFRRFESYVRKQDLVFDEVVRTMNFLRQVCREYDEARAVVVDSNHDRALERWIRESDWRQDPANMEFYLRSAHAKLRAIRLREDFHMLRYWYDRCNISGERLDVQFLDEDESFVICPDRNGGIECGMHGHLGPNGSRGSSRAFAKMGRKANVGHTHQAGIRDGIFTAGITGLVDQGYNVGPSSWSNSHVVTYENGKRAILTVWNDKWRADRHALVR